MSNQFYSHSGSAPVFQTRGSSANMRGEFDQIVSAFDAISNSVMAPAVESGSANSFVLTLNPMPMSQPSSATFFFQATHSNTGAATLRIGALAALPLLANDGSVLTASAISAGSVVGVFTNGVNAYLLSATKAYVDQTAFAAQGLPGQAGNAGKFLQTNGTSVSWGGSSGAGTVALPSVTVSDAATGFYRPAVNQIGLSVNGTLAELNQSTGKTVYGNVVFGTGITFPANMTQAQLLALVGAPSASGAGSSGTWAISITGTSASAGSANTANALNVANSYSGVTFSASGQFNGNGAGLTGTAGSLTAGYATSAGSAGSCSGNAASATLASKASTLAMSGGNGAPMTFNWAGQGGQPTYVWGSIDGTNHYVYNPSNFNVAYATSAGNGGVTALYAGSGISLNANTGGITITSAATTAEVLAATASASSLAVGTYAFLQYGASASIVAGTIYAGTGLYPADLGMTFLSGGGICRTANASAASPGTWRAMASSAYLTSFYPVSLFVRIS